MSPGLKSLLSLHADLPVIIMYLVVQAPPVTACRSPWWTFVCLILCSSATATVAGVDREALTKELESLKESLVGGLAEMFAKLQEELKSELKTEVRHGGVQSSWRGVYGIVHSC